MKNPIAIISNDWHLQQSNIDKIRDLVRQKCELAKKLGISTVFVLGDIFESRISQRQSVLVAFSEILLIFDEFEVNCVCLPGNHDKSDYSSRESFLVPFSEHIHFSLYNEYEEYDIVDGIRLHLMPFFKEDVWLEKFKPQILEDGKNILLTHVGFNGSKNNDGSEISSPIIPSLFKDFDLVLSGHYHNYHDVSSKIHHLPSICQNNFGEDDLKGFTVLYDDLSFEIIRSNFPKYIKKSINVEKLSSKEINKEIGDFIELNNVENDHLRIEFIGTKSKIDAIDKQFLLSQGIDVQKKELDLEVSEDSRLLEIKQFTINDLLDEFKQFCDKEGLDKEAGLKYLKQHLGI